MVVYEMRFPRGRGLSPHVMHDDDDLELNPAAGSKASKSRHISGAQAFRSFARGRCWLRRGAAYALFWRDHHLLSKVTPAPYRRYSQRLGRRIACDHSARVFVSS